MELILATGGYDEKVVLWNPSTEVAVRVFPLKDAHSNALAVTPDRKYLAVAAHKSLRVYDLESASSNPLHIYEGHSENIMAIGFPRSFNWVFTASEDGSIRVWDFHTARTQRVHFGSAAVNSAVLHPNQSEIVAAHEDGSLGVWDIASDAYRTLLAGEGEPVRSVQLSGDATLGAHCNNAGVLTLWRLGDELEVLKRVAAHHTYATACAFSADSKLVATCSADKTVKLWNVDVASEEVLWADKALIGHKMWVWGASFTCDSAYLASVSTDCTAKLWEVSSGRIARNYIGGHSKGITSLVLNDYALN